MTEPKADFDNENNGLSYETVSSATPEAMVKIAKRKGFLKFQFRSDVSWRDHVPLRQAASPDVRAVFGPET